MPIFRFVLHVGIGFLRGSAKELELGAVKSSRVVIRASLADESVSKCYHLRLSRAHLLCRVAFAELLYFSFKIIGK